MLKFLLPVDGSDASDRAIAEFITLIDWYKEKPEVHLLNVQFPQRGNVPLFIDKESIELYQQEEGMKELRAAKGILLGSVASKIIQLSTIPVLLIK